jgi:hypothetical protein
MDHTEIRRKLSAYLDNAVDTADRAKIDAHLAGCASCRKALGELERTVGHLKSLPEVEPPPWLTARIMARVRDAAQPRPAIWRRIFLPLHVKLPLEAIAIVFICITGYHIARMNAPQVPLSAPEPATREESAPPTQPAPHRPAAPSPATPAKALPKTPRAAPGIPAPVPGDKEETLTYAPPPPSNATAPPSIPSAAPQKTGPFFPEADKRETNERVEEQRAAERAARRYSYDASNSMMQKRGMQDEPYYSTGTSSASSGSSASRKLLSEQPEQEVMEERASRSKQAEQPARVEVTLKVDDPTGAVGIIEEAVIRSDGSIVRRTYGDASHLLVARIGAQNIPGLFARLEHIGGLQKPPQGTASKDGMVELAIKW